MTEYLEDRLALSRAQDEGKQLQWYTREGWIDDYYDIEQLSKTRQKWRVKPEPQVRWVNFYNNHNGNGVQFRVHRTVELALSEPRTRDEVAHAVRVEFPPGTFSEGEV
ncbi:MAG: hypothetical protein AAF358_13535 [Pseudomonadota bacterium]